MSSRWPRGSISRMASSLRLMRSMLGPPSDQSVQGLVDGAPLAGQLAEQPRAVVGEAVEALVALVFLAPFAGEQPLALQPPQHRVERAFVDLQAGVGQLLAQRVAVALGLERPEHRQDQAAAPQLQPQLLEQV